MHAASAIDADKGIHCFALEYPCSAGSRVKLRGIDHDQLRRFLHGLGKRKAQRSAIHRLD